MSNLSNSKIYPTNHAEPSEKAIMNGSQTSRNIYNGFAKTILTSCEVDSIHVALERICLKIYDITDSDDNVEEVDWIENILRSGEKKMNDLHNLFGAYDCGLAGDLSKQDSNKIDWGSLTDENESEPSKPSLSIVKNGDNHD